MGSKFEKIIILLMEEMPDLEGVIVSTSKGEILASHTILDRLNHKNMAQSSQEIYNSALTLGTLIEKGWANEIIIHYRKGFGMIFAHRMSDNKTISSQNNQKKQGEGSNDVILTIIAGEEAKTQLGLFKVNIKRALKQIERI